MRYVRQINSEIGKGIVFNEEIIRDSSVRIGGTSWKPDIPNEDAVKRFIENVTNNDRLPATDRAIETMLRLMRLQIFYDGNKRTAQLLANKVMIEGGAGVISVPVELQREFMEKLIAFYETDVIDDIFTFVYNNCIEGANTRE